MLGGTTMRAFKRQKLLHAIVFFIKNTRQCHKLKLFKLLHFLDFEIYRQTGKSTTGLRYHAWPKGPVPKDLHDELKHPQPDMRDVLIVRNAEADDPDSIGALQILARVPCDEDLFTKRELKVMRDLAEIFYDAKAADMSDVSHLRDQPWGRPWHQIYKVEKRPQALIPYTLALDDRPDSITREQAEEIEEEARALAGLFG
jgi:uncharacterized phage-associated protein